MREVCDMYGIRLDRRGFANCPFHYEKTPSFKVFADHFHCFGCGAHGDVIKFVMDYFGLTFWQAMTKLNEDCQLGLPITNATPKQWYAATTMIAQRRAERAKRELELTRANEAYHKALDAYAKADQALSSGDMEDQAYIDALQSIDLLSYELDQARSRLQEAERR